MLVFVCVYVSKRELKVLPDKFIHTCLCVYLCEDLY